MYWYVTKTKTKPFRNKKIVSLELIQTRSFSFVAVFVFDFEVET